MIPNTATVDILEDLNTYCDNYIGRFKSTDKEFESIWEEAPVLFKEFIVSERHMNFEPFSERQSAPIEFMFGDDPEKAFDNGNYLIVIEAGKGGGKDTIAWAIDCYMIYLLLCMKNPQKHLRLPMGEPIDTLNVSYTAGQAASVFFDRFSGRVKNWKWLQNKYHIKVSGSSMNAKEREGIFLDHVIVNQNGILFPKGIRAFSGSSSEESSEGFNLAYFCCDEISAFRDGTQTHNAQKMFDMLRTSATSRFGNRYKALIISYPRYKDDFIERLIKMYEKELHVYTDKATTWEMKPASCYSEKTFQYEGMTIPIDFQDEFRLHPESSCCKYACSPSGAESPLITRPHLVDMCVNRNRVPIFEFDDVIEEDKFGQKYIVKNIVKVNLPVVQKMYMVTVDLGLSGDSAAVSVGHLDESFDKIILDAHTAWIPSHAKGTVVSINNVEAIIEDMCRLIPMAGVFYDRWQSASATQKFALDGQNSGIVSVKFKDWLDMRERLYTERIDLLMDIELIGQIKQMQNIKNMRIDHPADGHDDRAYSLAALVKVLTSIAVNASKMHDEGEIVGQNVQVEGFTVRKGGALI